MSTYGYMEPGQGEPESAGTRGMVEVSISTPWGRKNRKHFDHAVAVIRGLGGYWTGRVWEIRAEDAEVLKQRVRSPVEVMVQGGGPQRSAVVPPDGDEPRAPDDQPFQGGGPPEPPAKPKPRAKAKKAPPVEKYKGQGEPESAGLIWADDGNQKVLYESRSRREAAEQYVAEGEWNTDELGHQDIAVDTWWHGDDDGETCGGDQCESAGHLSRDTVVLSTSTEPPAKPKPRAKAKKAPPVEKYKGHYGEGVGVLKRDNPDRIDRDGDTVVAERRPRASDNVARSPVVAPPGIRAAEKKRLEGAAAKLAARMLARRAAKEAKKTSRARMRPDVGLKKRTGRPPRVKIQMRG